MLRCLTAAGELSRQQHTLHAARLLQTVCLHQQLLPCLVTSICQEQAIHTNATTSSSKQHSSRLQQQQPHMPMCSPAAAPQSSLRQHSSSQRYASSSHSWQQTSTSSLQQETPLSTSSLQQHGVQQRHGYRSVSTGAAHYHARHSEYKMESLLIFESCWRRFADRYGMDFRVPREVVWLNGAPGSGKGINTEHILKTRGLTKHFTISGLLESFPDARRLIEAGEMIPDTLVGDLLLEALLLDEPGLQDDLGFVVDGFPRTACQVDFLKLLYDKMAMLHQQYADTPGGINFPRPSFKVVILYVDEETSIKRQLQRARVANLHNRRVLDAGAGHFFEERSTDTDIDKCRKRYAIFKTHYAATLRLKNYFPFTLIDAMGSIEETRQQITKELRYQSSLDLSTTTYELIRHLPLAKEVVLSARQEMVMRLDGYCEASRELFEEVIDRIMNDVLPVIRQSGLAGHAEYVTRSIFFTENPIAIDMLVDILTDRGFHVCYIREDSAVPERVDPKTGAVSTILKPCHKFRISFDARGPRDDIKVSWRTPSDESGPDASSGSLALEIAARMAESNASLQKDIRISHSVIPDHFEQEEDGMAEEAFRQSRGSAQVAEFTGS